MRIVVLDGYTTNPGDLCWDKLKELGECTIYDRTAPGEVLERAAGAEAILTNKVVINSETMAALPDLKYIGVMATGYNVVDINAARERGIIITNIPAYSTPSVGQMVFAHILNITQQVRHYSEEVSKGNWSKNPDFCFYDTPLIELLGKKIGISRANLYRKIKAISELSPTELIRNKRLEVALRYLKETNMSVSEVATLLGFNSHSYFSNSFKAFYGFTPTEFVQMNSANKEKM